MTIYYCVRLNIGCEAIEDFSRLPIIIVIFENTIFYLILYMHAVFVVLLDILLQISHLI